MAPKRPKLPGNTIDRLGATYQYLLGRKKDLAQPGIESTLNRDVRDALVSEELRQEMIGILFQASQQGLCSGRISEASLRLRENQFLVTRIDCWFQDLAEDDLILAITNAADILDSQQAPRCWEWHLDIYQGNPHTRAIILGQPSAVLALAKKNLLPDRELLPVAAEVLGEFFICHPDRSEISRLAESAKVLIIPAAGVLSLGSSLSEAAINLELINRLAEITLLA